MNDDIQSLIASLRRGQYEDPSEKIALLAAALLEHRADLELILVLLRAPQIPLRLAALEACRGRREPPVLDELARRVQDPEVRVRAKLAEVLGSFPDEGTTPPLKTLIEDAEATVRQAAVKAASGKPAFLDTHRRLLLNDPDWEVRGAAASALGEQNFPPAMADLLKALAEDGDCDLRQRCAEILDRQLSQARAAIEPHLPTEVPLLLKVDQALTLIGAQRFPNLLEWVRSRTVTAADPQELSRFGTDLTALAAQGALPRAYGVDEACQTLISMLRRDRWRSIALVGEAGAGKSAVVYELVHQLARPENGGWRVLRVSPSDFMAGTRYMGEWETRVKELITAVQKPRRVLIYVPNLSDLSAVGRWSKSDSNVAAALAPYLEEGALVLLGESTPTEYEQGLGAIPSLQRLFDKVLLPEASLERTRQILTSVSDEAGQPVAAEVLERLLDFATQYLSHLSRPGNAVLLLRDLLAARKQADEAIGLREVLRALAKSTGLPSTLLDDSVPLQLEEVKAFFESRIMGQPEAVEAVIDLVLLIKAGLTDPGKPFGVFLFTGPTGVGKTELARALAEFIFGDAARLQRFDMSEYASPDGFERLIGGKEQNGLLTDAVRRHPFSVVLLDEIEKSHLNVFDLCLQIFDAGRLTDGRGRTVDFRRTILILTSNIGSVGPSTPLGFSVSPQADLPEADKDRTLRELSRFFRPEFLNRIDRIVHFRPLSLDVAERIARREIELVLQRKGIARRELVVDIDPSVISLLVREGYSPHFGARPLKRTVERLCLLPLARAIATGRIAGKAVLALTLHDGQVQVRLTRSAEPKPAKPAAPPAEPLREAGRRLVDDVLALEPRIRPLADRKSELLEQTQAPGFYHHREAREAIFDEIHKLDQFLAWHDRVRRARERLQHRLEQGPISKTDEPGLREQMEQLAAERDQLRLVTTCRDARDLDDALLCLSLVDRTGAAQNGVEKLARMYLGLADLHRMSGEVLAEFQGAKTDRAWLRVSGLGAYALLKHEAGLHQLDHRYRIHAPRGGHEKEHEDRELIRADVRPAGAEPDKKFIASLKSGLEALKPPRTRLVEKADLAVCLFHEPSLRSLEIWTRGPKAAALDTAHRILFAQVGLEEERKESELAAVIRCYHLGIGSRIKDLRSGRTTTRLAQVFKGHLEMFHAATSEGG
jgi:ATP-dependent Clp protease ATP-binding subunit ClpC